jgi:excisionase family DNA binding protein
VDAANPRPSLYDLLAAKPCWTAPELAAVLCVSPKLIYKLVRERRIPFFRIGTAVRFCGKSVSGWIWEKEQGAKKRSAQR